MMKLKCVYCLIVVFGMLITHVHAGTVTLQGKNGTTVVRGRTFVNNSLIQDRSAAMVRITTPENGGRILVYGNRFINRNRILGRSDAHMIRYQNYTGRRMSIESRSNLVENRGKIEAYN
ncbi:hypothetical protein [Desulfobacter latus]|uniref:Organic solvent tolerance-like N-terminal domain-containing protein n=1 Tax=Desulfobacter latus TaxID=2292 RepID=A0A850T9E7_9BACT|nr:hypothetical protein [Desulfobacter latus]NWH06182.1 hypothetical protein [Desulfobacter latus]